MILLICVLFNTTAPLRAATLESAFAERLVRTRRPRDLERLRGQFDHARVSRLTCSLQNARGTAPIECYRVLATERAWRILDEANFRRRRRGLDAACARASLNLRVPETGTSLANVSADCVARVRDARLTRAYRREDRTWSED